ncbi:hypothetical protein BDA96_01G187500 [Sorghum bicolor]|uniref:Uncharacterized protein n=2 Tax=Sorghum bicolor TaxID=4558 RepID=A0A921S194_SORBI|nr:hypothetical protein BDA96_01G187500 [Sorghum bicolor]KXG38089.1 hypothetical protein SORBI_3001G178800 [Sorghum bicolor]
MQQRVSPPLPQAIESPPSQSVWAVHPPPMPRATSPLPPQLPLHELHTCSCCETRRSRMPDIQRAYNFAAEIYSHMILLPRGSDILKLSINYL